MFNVDTGLKLTECPTNIEVIITQVLLAVPDNFWKIERSSDTIEKVRFPSYRTRPGKCTTRMEIRIIPFTLAV